MLLSLRDGHLTTDDWQYLMTRSAARVSELDTFTDALHLYPTVENVAEHNVNRVKKL